MVPPTYLFRPNPTIQFFTLLTSFATLLTLTLSFHLLLSLLGLLGLQYQVDFYSLLSSVRRRKSFGLIAGGKTTQMLPNSIKEQLGRDQLAKGIHFADLVHATSRSAWRWTRCDTYRLSTLMASLVHIGSDDSTRSG